MSRLLRLLVGAVLVASIGLLPAVARAATIEPTIRVSGVDYAAGKVSIGARCATSTAEIALFVESSQLATLAPSPILEEVSFPLHRLAAQTTFVVVGRNPDGGTLWRRWITLDPASYRPGIPVLSAPANKVVPSRWNVSGTANRPITWAKVYVRQTERYRIVRMSVNGAAAFTVNDVPIPYGPATLVVRVKNGFGSSEKKVRRFYRLGTKLPKTKRFVLVCRKTLWMYHVYKGRVVNRWPIAIGTPQTPTPSGTFKIGEATAPGWGDWGVLRRRLHRVRDGETYPTKYYIHGTYERWSIGLEASHGCIRMYNSHVRRFKKVVPNGTVVRIR
jgi:hypothetical protein